MTKIVHVEIEHCSECPYFEYNQKTPFLSDEFECTCDGPYLDPTEYDFNKEIHPDCPLDDKKEI